MCRNWSQTEIVPYMTHLTGSPGSGAAAEEAQFEQPEVEVVTVTDSWKP